MTFRLSRKAEDDLVDIFLTGARQFGAELAERQHMALGRVFQKIADNPQMAAETSDLTPAAHIYTHGSHKILYLADEADGILIVRVLVDLAAGVRARSRPWPTTYSAASPKNPPDCRAQKSA